MNLIREKSILPFLAKWHVNGQLITFQNRDLERSAADYLNEAIYLKKDCPIKAGETVTFEFDDRTNRGCIPVLTVYTYQVAEYDDFAFELTLAQKSAVLPE